jgi:hypothetical protein
MRAAKFSALLRIATAVLLPTLCAFARTSESPPPFTIEDEPPYRAQWGSYVVTVTPTVFTTSGSEQRFGITDASGNPLLEIRAPFINLVDYPDLDGRHGGDFIRIITHPESNTLADIRTYCFTRRGGLRKILAMPYTFDTLRDLDGDGRPELISDSPAPLEWAAGLCHGCCPSVMVVLRWNGKHYVVATRRFPNIARRKAAEYRGEFLRVMRRFDQNGDAHASHDTLMSPALGYWANLALIGDEARAEKEILRRLPSRLREELPAVGPELRGRLAQIPKSIR